MRLVAGNAAPNNKQVDDRSPLLLMRSIGIRLVYRHRRSSIGLSCRSTGDFHKPIRIFHLVQRTIFGIPNASCALFAIHQIFIRRELIMLSPRRRSKSAGDSHLLTRTQGAEGALDSLAASEPP